LDIFSLVNSSQEYSRKRTRMVHKSLRKFKEVCNKLDAYLFIFCYNDISMDPARPRFETVEVDDDKNNLNTTDINSPNPPMVAPVEVPPPPLPPARIATVEPPPPVPTASVEEHVVASKPTEPASSVWMKRLTFLVPALAILITLVTASFAMKQMMDKKSNVSPSPSPQINLIQATPEATLRPVVKYKSYRSEIYGIAFTYAEDLFLVECDNAIYLLLESSDPQTLCDEKPNVGLNIMSSSETLLVPNEEGVEKRSEEVTTIGGVDGLKIPKENGWEIYFENKNKHYKIGFSDARYETHMQNLVSSFGFTVLISQINFKTYNNSAFRYSLKHPEDWQVATGSADTTEFIKDQNTSFVIQAQNNVSDAELSAQELVSSIRTLAGWKNIPTADIRNFSGATARVMQGQFNGKWQANAVVWYRNRLLQITWNDPLSQQNQQIFDLMIGSLVLRN
jgi:hypothetical protein